VKCCHFASRQWNFFNPTSQLNGRFGLSRHTSESDKSLPLPPCGCGLTAGVVSFDTQKGESGAQFRTIFLLRLVPEPHSLIDLLFGNARRFNPSPRQVEDKLKYTRQAASQNDPRAEFHIGVDYSSPDCPEPDLSTAAKWFQ
jgi:hypothetical protein